MKTYNYTFNKNEFIDKIDYSIFENEKNILIQLFSGGDKYTLLYISNLLQKEIPQAIYIGTTTDGEINNSVITTGDTVISISVFEATTLCAHMIENDVCFESGYETAKAIIKDNTKHGIIYPAL